VVLSRETDCYELSQSVTEWSFWLTSKAASKAVVPRKQGSVTSNTD
jgi:hypothetical protein